MLDYWLLMSSSDDCMITWMEGQETGQRSRKVPFTIGIDNQLSCAEVLERPTILGTVDILVVKGCICQLAYFPTRVKATARSYRKHTLSMPFMVPFSISMDSLHEYIYAHAHLTHF